MRSLVRRKNGSHWFDDFKFYRPIFFTGVLNDRLGYGEGDFVIDDLLRVVFEPLFIFCFQNFGFGLHLVLEPAPPSHSTYIRIWISG